MKNLATLRSTALVAALAAIAATAWATNEPLSNSVWVPAPTVVSEPVLVTEDRVIVPAHGEVVTLPGETVIVSDPLPSNERVMPLEAAALPRVEPSAPQPRIYVEQRRFTTDERIQAQLLDVLASAPDVSGKIGVESNDSVVTLSGWTTTAAQARRAARYAYGIDGVKSVQNEIRARVGGSV